MHKGIPALPSRPVWGRLGLGKAKFGEFGGRADGNRVSDFARRASSFVKHVKKKKKAARCASLFLGLATRFGLTAENSGL